MFVIDETVGSGRGMGVAWGQERAYLWWSYLCMPLRMDLLHLWSNGWM